MSLYSCLFGERIQQQCGAFGCSNTVFINPDKGVPEVAICTSCVRRFNTGIIQDVHAHTGNLTGSYNIFDERYLPDVR